VNDYPKLQNLIFARNIVGELAAQTFTRNRSLSHLEKVDLGRCKITPAVAAILATVSLPQLRELRLNENPLGAEGVARLLDGPFISTVQKLVLGRTDLGDRGAEVLARSQTLSQVKRLQLDHNNITMDGATLLAESALLTHVASLDLSDNAISDADRASLKQRYGPRVNF